MKLMTSDTASAPKDVAGPPVRGVRRAARASGLLVWSNRPVAADGARRGDPRAVGKDQVSEVAQAAKIREGRAAIAIVVRRPDAGNGAREITQDLFGDVALTELDLFLADNRHRRRCDKVGIAD